MLPCCIVCGDYFNVYFQELMYLWGFFNMFAKDSEALEKSYKVVIDEVARLKPLYECDPTYLPDWCLVRFMQGTFLRYMKEFDKAEKILKEVVAQYVQLTIIIIITQMIIKTIIVTKTILIIIPAVQISKMKSIRRRLHLSNWDFFLLIEDNSKRPKSRLPPRESTVDSL